MLINPRSRRVIISIRAFPHALMTLPQALREWRFWVLAISFVPISYAIGAIIPNIERVLRANEFGMDEAVGLATLTGLAVLGGRIIGGYLIDRFWAPGVAFAFLASPAIALWMLAQPGVTPTTATIAILMIGFGAGVEYDFMVLVLLSIELAPGNARNRDGVKCMIQMPMA